MTGSYGSTRISEHNAPSYRPLTVPFRPTYFAGSSKVVSAVLSAIGSESSLAVLGLAPKSLPTLGNMIQWARDRSAIMLGRWWWILPPIVTTMILFIGLFMLIIKDA